MGFTVTARSQNSRGLSFSNLRAYYFVIHNIRKIKKAKYEDCTF